MSVKFNDHVRQRMKNPLDVLRNITPLKVHLNHCAVGIAGESGELLDAVKKHFYYNKPLDRANVIEELGDIEFYMAAMRLALGLTREEILEANQSKLEKRYPTGYSDKAAVERADKE